MEQSTDGTRFPLWRALALGGFAAAAFTAIALFGTPSSAHADDGADPSLLGAVTEVVDSLDRPIDAVAAVVDVVDTTVVEPVVDVVDDTVAAVPVANTVVEETVGPEPVATIVEPVVQTVEDTVDGLGDVVAAVPVPSVPVVVPTVPVPSSPAPVGPAPEQAGDTPTAPAPTSAPAPVFGPPSAPLGDLASSDAGTDRERASVHPSADAVAPSTTTLPATPGGLPALPAADDHWAVSPSGSSSSGSGAAANGPVSGEQSAEVAIPAPGVDRRAIARDDDLPASPTFPADTAPD
ncbi:hypothetical protein ASF83_07385 [Plantibacter sp. Leaf171]|uniref:hypothetical protein n=1 Tax=unclassified Plantibacter TaxID=2624265 RepID=UPI0006F3D7AF|nr:MULTISPECIES: hypothetical protein [unclassified Plantibacter]KQM15745.1 hypothetical protein ASE44_07400 [Plantibacter sp. Leaf1]KQR58888.1 hypothetical protein ASF83_07385 [Plantibacter sp. Leaf171]